MATREPGHDAWARLDETSDPSYYVRFLDATRQRTLAAAKSNPGQFFADWHIEPGHWILDVGCGTGDFDLLLARLVGPSGRIVGVDHSATMVAEARRRAEGSGVPVEFRRGDAHALEFGDATFDRVAANAVLQHLGDPGRALREMVRVTKPGGWVDISEHDWGASVLDAEDRATTRHLLDFFADSIPDGWIGRKLPAMFRDAGIADVTVAGTFVPVPAQGALTWVLRDCVRRGAGVGIVTEAEASHWLAEQEARAREERFFYGFIVIRAVGRKP